MSTDTPPLLRLIEEMRRSADELMAAANDRMPPPTPSPSETGHDAEGELYAEINAAVLAAIRDSGLSREQVLDHANARFGRDGADGKRPVSIHILNNMLAESKPESRLPLWLIEGICAAVQSVAPVAAMARRLGAVVLSETDALEARLGKLDSLQREVSQGKAEIRRMLRRIKG
jgi:hypothetical protein